MAKACWPTVKWADVTIVSILPSSSSSSGSRRLSNDQWSWSWTTSSYSSSSSSLRGGQGLRGGGGGGGIHRRHGVFERRDDESNGRELDGSGVTVIYVVVSGSLTGNQMSAAVTQVRAPQSNPHTPVKNTHTPVKSSDRSQQQ